MAQLPTHAQIVIIGGGIIGCSLAYHLTKLGRRDVLLLERKKLTSGTTWHAAGLVRAMLYTANLTKLAKYTVDLYKTLEQEVYRSARFGYEFTVLFIDLDHFKQVNDTHGHLIGSKLLSEIGYLIKAQLRLIDYAFRYGGDEFVILLPQTGKDSALVVAKRLRDNLRTTPFCSDEGLNLTVKASIGLATYPHDAKTPHDIIRQADEMMYLVKNTTRDNIGVAQRGIMK